MDASVRRILSILLVFVLVGTPQLFPEPHAGESNLNAAPRLEIAFDYQRQKGIASNQFAVWIENSSGTHVKTIYATRFTAAGGWRKRPACLPKWVAAAGPDGLSPQAVDAFTGATPIGGRLHYAWDGTDQFGNIAPPEIYRYLVEANLRWDNRVVYSGRIEVGGQAQTLRPQPEYVGDPGEERGMIGDVVVTYHP